MEGWDGKTTESLIAELGGVTSVEPHNLFPSEEATKFGDWVKAGALKVGDEISIRGGVDAVSGDETVTIKSIKQDNTSHRVYNLEIESKDGQITHNYFVGKDQLWVHNDKGLRIGPLIFFGPNPRNGGRLFGVRCGGSSGTKFNIFRLDKSPIPGCKTPILHCHIGPNQKPHYPLNPLRWWSKR